MEQEKKWRQTLSLMSLNELQGLEEAIHEEFQRRWLSRKGILSREAWEAARQEKNEKYELLHEELLPF